MLEKQFDISSMLECDVYNHSVQHIELIETHISWVILTGEFAYKIKKPVDFGFLDFSTLGKRHSFCQQELELNRRMATGIYLEVVPITKIEGKLVISGGGKPVEYAVKMRQFPQSCQFDNMLLAGELTTGHMDALARMLANFHLTTRRIEDCGSIDLVCQPVEENFIQINQHLGSVQYPNVLNELQQWSKSSFVALKPVFEERARDGFVRECHGDLHLRNLVWLNETPVAFDCIEFNAGLSRIDVISDMAFLLMDLHSRQQKILASRFLNCYLEVSGDYAGLSVLPFYLCYRAMVRAKVDALRLEQETLSEEETEQSRIEFAAYLELAASYRRQATPTLIIMRGVSASGKSTVSQQLLEALGAIRVRSDVERKRLFNIDPHDSAATEIESGIYSKEATGQTYSRLAELASGIIRDGFSVIVDAAFPQYAQRTVFQSLARGPGIPFVILDIWAPEDVLRQRIISRKREVSDADITVLEDQLGTRESLHKDESDYVISLDTDDPFAIDAIIDRIKRSKPPTGV